MHLYCPQAEKYYFWLGKTDRLLKKKNIKHFLMRFLLGAPLVWETGNLQLKKSFKNPERYKLK